MANSARNDILDLSISKRIQPVEDIWDSIAEVPESLSLTDEQKTELDRRLDGYHQRPVQGFFWQRHRDAFYHWHHVLMDSIPVMACRSKI